jgi:hypothetical protein
VGEVVVLNSNRMSVIDRIPLPDPTSFAMSPNLDLLAVTNQGADSVSFIDIEPGHTTFHTVIKTVKVGHGPTGIAWEPGNEDILVCNTGGNTISVISAAGSPCARPSPTSSPAPWTSADHPAPVLVRQFRNVYYAYVLNSDGKVSVFESGPDGVKAGATTDHRRPAVHVPRAARHPARPGQHELGHMGRAPGPARPQTGSPRAPGRGDHQRGHHGRRGRRALSRHDHLATVPSATSSGAS